MSDAFRRAEYFYFNKLKTPFSLQVTRFAQNCSEGSQNDRRFRFHVIKFQTRKRPRKGRFTDGRESEILNIDLNQMSHRYVSGVLQNDWNDTSTFPHLKCKIWVSLSYKTVNTVVSSLYYLKKKVKSVIDSAVLHWTMQLMVFPRNGIMIDGSETAIVNAAFEF